jgi:hypothetical protein
LTRTHEQWVLTSGLTTLGPDAGPKAKAFREGLQTRSPGSAAMGVGLALAPRVAQRHMFAACDLQPHLACGHLGLACPSARCLQFEACNPTKTEADHFLPKHPFNAIYISVKRHLRPPPTIFPTFCGKGSSAIIVLQSTMLCVYLNNNIGTDLF